LKPTKNISINKFFKNMSSNVRAWSEVFRENPEGFSRKILDRRC